MWKWFLISFLRVTTGRGAGSAWGSAPATKRTWWQGKSGQWGGRRSSVEPRFPRGGPIYTARKHHGLAIVPSAWRILNYVLSGEAGSPWCELRLLSGRVGTWTASQSPAPQGQVSMTQLLGLLPGFHSVPLVLPKEARASILTCRCVSLSAKVLGLFFFFLSAPPSLAPLLLPSHHPLTSPEDCLSLYWLWKVQVVPPWYLAHEIIW